MSKQAWREFSRSEGVEDWVVLHGGAAAVFVVPSMAEATRLAQAVAVVPGFAGSGALMTIGDHRLSVRLTRGIEFVEPRHVEVARAISEVAREHGARADRGAVQEVSLAVAARPDELDVGFWR